ncbi:MAG: T9SS C-terminal target domain-containing protein [Chitinophagaceae bacterium]|nr:MAG: T9SS C-terminal target domain-containing protein [Chitinophagaceae bacterium]
MKALSSFILFLFVFSFSCLIFAADYEKYLENDKMVIFFPEDEKYDVGELLKKSEQFHDIEIVKSYFIPSPKLQIISFNKAISWEQKEEIFSSVNLAGDVMHLPYLKNNEGFWLGILPDIFVSVNSEAERNSLILNMGKQGWEFEPVNHLPKNVYKFSNRQSSGKEILDLAISLNNDADYLWAEPGYFFFPDVHDVPDDPIFFRQWHIENEGTAAQGNGVVGADISGLDAWTVSKGNPDIKVAIVDSGVDTLHPDLSANFYMGFDATGGNSNGFPNQNYSQDAHGTAATGIISAIADNGIGVAGIANECKFMAVKSFYYIDSLIGIIPFATSEYFSSGLIWAYQNGADVINNSWTIPPLFLALLPGNPALIDAALEEASTNGRNGKGTVLFFSSGNDGDPPYWPSDLEMTIAVNATSMCDERKSPDSCDGENWEGNYGETINISAPGVRIPTTDMQGTKGYTNGNYTLSYNGTSAASAVASGVGALILSVNPDLTAEEVAYILYTTADKIEGCDYSTYKNGSTWCPELGHGRVNAYQALLSAQDFEGISSVNNSVKNHYLRIYPNPVRKSIHFNHNFNHPVKLTIYNINGQFVYDKIFTILPNKINIDEILSSGFYILKLTSDRESITKKIIVQ